MATNRIFICHVVRSEKPEDAQILRYIKEALGKTGIEIVTHKNDGTEESFFQQLREELPTCQTFLLLQTPDAIYAPRVRLAVKAALQLFEQKKLQGIFRFICPPATKATIPTEWKGFATFDGTRNSQRAITKLVLNILAKSKKGSKIAKAVLAQEAKTGAVLPSPFVGREEPAHTSRSQTNSVNSVNNNIPLVPLDAIPTTAMPVLDRVSIADKPSQTANTNSVNNSILEIVSTSTPRPESIVSIADKPSQTRFIDSTSSNKSLEIAPTSALPVLRRANAPQTIIRVNYDKPPKPSLWKRLKERRRLLTGVAIALVILTLIGSAGTLFFLNASSPQPVTTVAAPPSNPTIGQVSFFGSDQIDASNSTGIADKIQVNLKKLTSPTAGQSYYAWLLPNPGNSINGRNIFLGAVTINNGAASFAFANPTHENLLLTESTFLITEESSSSPPSTPSPDQRVWRYIGIIPQTPSSLDPNHASNLDHVRHLLASDPLLREVGIQGGLGTWFYANVQKVLEWANAAKGTGEQQGFDTVHRNLVRILDVLDGANNVAGDVPKGTPIVVEPPQIAHIPLLTLDPVHQNPLGYVDYLKTHLQGLTASPGATDTERTIATQIDRELEKIEPLLKKVREDAKQLVNLSLKDLADPKNSPVFTDMLNNANAAFIGELDPATNKRQGGATFIHDILPQIAAIDVKVFTSL